MFSQCKILLQFESEMLKITYVLEINRICDVSVLQVCVIYTLKYLLTFSRKHQHTFIKQTMSNNPSSK